MQLSNLQGLKNTVFIFISCLICCWRSKHCYPENLMKLTCIRQYSIQICNFSKEILIVSIYSLTMTFLISGRECLYIGLFVGWLGCQFVSVSVLKRLETNPLFDQTKNLLSFQNMKKHFCPIYGGLLLHLLCSPN